MDNYEELLARVEALEAQASNYPETPDSSTPPPEPPTELPPLLAAALKLREENDLSRLFLPKPAPPPKPLTGQITFNAPPTEEVIRLDKEGFHYKGQFIADAGEAHRVMLLFLKQNTKDEDDYRWPHL